MKRWCAGEGGEEGGRAGGGKVDGGADRATRELEGPKETTRVEPRRWPREKEQAKWKRDARRTAAEWDERRLRGVKGVRTALGTLDKGGVGRSVDEGSG